MVDSAEAVRGPLACVGRDSTRLDHRRLHGADGHVGVRPGADRRSAVAGRIRRRRLPGLAPRPDGPGGGLELAVRPAVRPDRRDSARRHPRLARGGARLPPPPQARRPAGRARRRRRRAARRLPRPVPVLGGRGGGAQHSRRERAARADPALEDPRRAERGAAAVGTADPGARALRPVPADRGAAGRRAAAELAHRARPAGAPRARQRRQGARHGVRPRRPGQRLDRRGRRRRDERPRRGGPGRHDGAARRRGRPHRRRGDLVRRAQRPRDPARARPRRCARAAPQPGRAGGRLGGDPRLPRERPLRRAPRPARPHLDGRDAGRLRARPGRAQHHLAARAGALGQLGRADGGCVGARRDDDLRRLGLRTADVPDSASRTRS